jgi:outer membrane murein-binding lipoprotein Lpp
MRMNAAKLWRTNWITAIVLVAIASGINFAHADDLKISQLEQDVRELKQQIFQLTRRIDQLESEQRNSNAAKGGPERVLPRAIQANGDSQRVWLNIANWDRVRIGMSELDVLQLLGPPTTLRKSNDGANKSLMYALEIGTGSFLSGSVELDKQKVVAVTKPVLR